METPNYIIIYYRNSRNCGIKRTHTNIHTIRQVQRKIIVFSGDLLKADFFTITVGRLTEISHG